MSNHSNGVEFIESCFTEGSKEFGLMGSAMLRGASVQAGLFKMGW